MEKNRRTYVRGKDYACVKRPQAQLIPQPRKNIPEEGLTKCVKIKIRNTQFLPVVGFKVAQAFSVLFVPLCPRCSTGDGGVNCGV